MPTLLPSSARARLWRRTAPGCALLAWPLLVGAPVLLIAPSAAHAQTVPVAAPSPVRDDPSVPALRWSGDTAFLGDGRVIPPLPRLLGVREQFDERMRWLAERHQRLLPMMRAHGVGMWIVMNEEFHNDPLTEHVAPPMVYVSRRDAHVFVDGGERGLLRYSNYWRPTASYAEMFEPLPAPRTDRGTSNLTLGLRELVARVRPATIALAINGPRGQDGGLSRDSYALIVDAIGPEYAKRIIPAAPLIEEYLDTRVSGELEHYRQLVLVTDLLAQRVLSNEVITPGVTTAADVAWWFNDQVARLGVGATPWFEVHTAVQRFDPVSNAMIPYVHPAPDDYVFQAGDVVHLDCGFNYMGLASDWQKVAYILPPGQTAVPAGLEVALHNAMRTRETLRAVARPGMTGYAAAEATVSALTGVAFTPSIYSHPIGTHGHGVGPSINARGAILPAPPERDSPLRLGSYRSIELSATTRIEDDAVLTPHGYEWFRPPQNRWYLIRSVSPVP